MPRRLLLSGVSLSTAILSTALVAAQVPPAPSTPPRPYPTSQDDDLSQVPVIRLLDDVDPNPNVVSAGGVDEPQDANEELLRQMSRLRKERDDLAKEREKLQGRAPETDTAAAVELAQLRGRLTTVLQRLSAIPPAVRPGNPVQEATLNPEEFHPPGPNMANSPVRARPLGDPYLQAQALFRSGQYKEALAAYRGLQAESLNGEERLLVQYLCACCLRKLGKLDEAATLYRQVADAREDDLLTECSLWHLGTIGWRRDLEKQLSEIRAARQVR